MNAMAEVRFFPQSQYQQLDTRFDVEFGILWGFMNPVPRPTFNVQILSDLKSYISSIVNSAGITWSNGSQHNIDYAVIASKTPGIFNLGGDLALFSQAIRNQDRNILVEYGRNCIDNLFLWSCNCNLPLTTIALVQGDALGGGFECALSSTVLVAEESARLGFPEILFNLFPGMGAYSFLRRKVGQKLAEELITSGNIYSAYKLHEMGVVDIIAPNGAGESVVRNFVKEHRKYGNGRRAIEKVRREVSPITHEELMSVVNIWADAALHLDGRDLRMMERLLRAQHRGTEQTIVQNQASVAHAC